MLEAILSAYSQDCQPTSFQPLGNAGGFSGAQLWRLNVPRGTLCVRRWPAKHPTVEGLHWMHRVLTHVHKKNCHFVPVPLQNLSGNSFLLFDGHLWEVTPWMAGEADFRHDPSDVKLEAALQALARFHIASQTLQAQRGVSRGLKERAEFSSKLADGELQRWQATLSSRTEGDYLDKCKEILSLSAPLVQRLPGVLLPLSSTQFSLQPCLRDIWHDHILFTRNEVRGIVDFGAMRMESVVGDVARLLGSLVGDDDQRRTTGMAAYEAIRPLMHMEKLAVEAFDLANVALSGLSWVRWLMFDEKTFDNIEGVHQRLDAAISRLRDSKENSPFLP